MAIITEQEIMNELLDRGFYQQKPAVTEPPISPPISEPSISPPVSPDLPPLPPDTYPWIDLPPEPPYTPVYTPTPYTPPISPPGPPVSPVAAGDNKIWWILGAVGLYALMREEG